MGRVKSPIELPPDWSGWDDIQIQLIDIKGSQLAGMTKAVDTDRSKPPLVLAERMLRFAGRDSLHAAECLKPAVDTSIKVKQVGGRLNPREISAYIFHADQNPNKGLLAIGGLSILSHPKLEPTEMNRYAIQAFEATNNLLRVFSYPIRFPVR